jgi:hypothetical protein
VRFDLPHRAHQAEDLDSGSCGIAKLFEGTLGRPYPGMPWEPKLTFTALAERYRGG